MKPFIIVMIAAAILVLVLNHKHNTVNSKAKKALQPAKRNKENGANDYLFYQINLRFRLF